MGTLLGCAIDLLSCFADAAFAVVRWARFSAPYADRVAPPREQTEKP